MGEEFWGNTSESSPLDPGPIDTINDEIVCTLRRTFPETLEALRKAKAQGIAVGMISNHTTFWFKECADACQIYELIPRELVIVSSDAASCKPDADIFEVFLKRLAAAHPGLVASDCIFVDDKDANIEA